MPFDPEHPEIQEGYNAKYYALQHVPVEAGQRYTFRQTEMIQNKVMPDKELAEHLGRTIRAIEAKRQNIAKGSIVRASDATFETPKKAVQKKGTMTEAEFNAWCDAQDE
jgi:hypothetical protein